MKGLDLDSYAKLNLYLKVLRKRPDNYHSIFTLFERVDLSDQIRLRPLPRREIRMILSGIPTPAGRNNLAYQAAGLLQREFGVNEGVEIGIRKRIPVSAGLGGGSSNAASVLSGLNRLWKLNLGVQQLAAFARRIGSDVPFFLYNSSFASATSRGDEIKALRLPVKLWHVMVVPRIKILSSLVYKRWDKAKKATRLNPPFQQSCKGLGQESVALTNHQSVIRILKSALLKKELLKLGKMLFNSLEEISSNMYPVIRKIRAALSDLGIKAISMSGSGPSVFGLVSSRKEAYELARQLRKLGNWDVFVVKTI